jgi:hypothetical protein
MIISLLPEKVVGFIYFIGYGRQKRNPKEYNYPCIR